MNRSLSYQLLQRSTPLCKQLRYPRHYGEMKNKCGQTLLHMAVGLEQERLAVSLLEARVPVTAVNARGETAWQSFIRAWVLCWSKAKFYIMLKAFVDRFGASVDVTCDGSRGESTLHRYGRHLEAIKIIRRANLRMPRTGIVYQVSMPGAVDDSIRGLFLLLNAGCRVNARDKFQDLPFQTSVFGDPNSDSAIPLLEEMWKMLAAAGSRLSLSFNEEQKLEIFLNVYTSEQLAVDLLPLHPLGLVTTHSAEAKARPRARIRSTSVCDDVIAKLCRPLTLKDLCLRCIRMNCYPNAFVAARKLPLPATLQEKVRPLYQTYSEQFRRTVPSVEEWQGRRITISLPQDVGRGWRVGDIFML